MPTTTTNYSLWLYNSTTDQSENFADWRGDMAGITTGANMYKIDSALKVNADAITALEGKKSIIVVEAVVTSQPNYISSVSGYTAYTTGDFINLSVDTDTTGTAQLNINSIAVKSLMKVDSTGAFVNLTDGDLLENRSYLFKYDGTRWLWVSAVSADQVNISGTSGNLVTVSSSGGIEEQSASTSRTHLNVEDGAEVNPDLMTETEAKAGTAVTERVINAAVMKAAVVEHAPSGEPEGTAIKSTGETGGTKYLREDGDGTCSWQVGSSSYNLLINGDMKVDQRHAGASQTIVAGSAKEYTVDRMYAYCEGANVVGEQVAGTGKRQYHYQFTGAVGVSAIQFGQRVEQKNSYHVSGETIKISVDMANTLLTTVTWTAYYANSADTFGTIASPTRTQIDTGTFSVDSTMTRYSADISIPSAATTGVEIVLSVGAQVSGTWTIGNVQLGLQDEFERQSYNTQLSNCIRYYERVYVAIRGYHPVDTGAGYRNIFTHAYWHPKRNIPSVTLDAAAWTWSVASIKQNGCKVNFIYYGTNGGGKTDMLTVENEL